MLSQRKVDSKRRRGGLARELPYQQGQPRLHGVEYVLLGADRVPPRLVDEPRALQQRVHERGGVRVHRAQVVVAGHSFLPIPSADTQPLSPIARTRPSRKPDHDRDQLDTAVVPVPLHALQRLEVGLVKAHVLRLGHPGRMQADQLGRVLRAFIVSRLSLSLSLSLSLFALVMHCQDDNIRYLDGDRLQALHGRRGGRKRPTRPMVPEHAPKAVGARSPPAACFFLF